MTDAPIECTFIREEFMWDRMSDVDWSLLRNNLKAARRILRAPEKFPHANFPFLEQKVDALETFLVLNGGSYV